MSLSPRGLPDRATERHLHQRLLAGELIAPSDLAVAYLEPLVIWLGQRKRNAPIERADRAFIEEAADESILSLIRNPTAYDPEQKDLFTYLCMAAQGDLLNLLAKEKKHRKSRKSWKSVELSAKAGKYLGKNEDPSFGLRLREQRVSLRDELPSSVREGLTEIEAQIWQLMLSKERKTAAYAEVMGITYLSIPEQRKEVKRMKDRLNKQRERAGGKP